MKSKIINLENYSFLNQVSCFTPLEKNYFRVRAQVGFTPEHTSCARKMKRSVGSLNLLAIFLFQYRFFGLCNIIYILQL